MQSFIEHLETRSLFAAGGIHTVVDVPLLVLPGSAVKGLSRFEVQNGTLFITGTHKADSLTLSRSTNGFVRVPASAGTSSDGQVKFIGGSGSAITWQTLKDNDTPLYQLNVGGQTYAFSAPGINHIVISGGEGNDTIRVGKNVRTQTTVNGGAGNDTLEAGHNTDILNGNAGDDTLVSSFDSTTFNRYRGGDGTDKLFAKLPGGQVPTFNSIESIIVTVQSTGG